MRIRLGNDEIPNPIAWAKARGRTLVLNNSGYLVYTANKKLVGTLTKIIGYKNWVFSPMGKIADSKKITDSYKESVLKPYEWESLQ